MSLLIIAEKPSLARSIADAIDPRPVNNSRQGVGWIDTTKARLTWCFGHMLELASPETYRAEWSQWTLKTLPMLVEEDQWQIKPKDGAKAQIDCIRNCLKEATRVIHAGDPDREGQMLVDELLEHLGWEGKTDRLLIQDPSPEGIRASLRKLQPNTDFANLYRAALCRSRADWLVGMNFTRAATKRIGPLISIGRVQTPTLAMVVRRDLEIERHVARTFHTLHAAVANKTLSLTLVHDDEKARIFDAAVAKDLAKRIEGQMVELTITTATELERSPLPYTASTFHKDAEKAFGWSAARSLQVLQSLYEKQLVSYPRTDCAYLPAEQAAGAVPMARAIIAGGYFSQANSLQLEPKSRVYDDAKVEEHHGLVPTRKLPPNSLDQAEKDAWSLIAMRFIASLAPDDQVETTTVAFVAEGRTFATKGQVPMNRATSWRSLVPPSKQQAVPLPKAITDPNLDPKVLIRTVEIKAGKTTPPKPYTEASLRVDMNAAAKFVTDEHLRSILKETDGIGTAATQPSIIETLKQRKYVALEGRGKVKHLRSTNLGRYVISAIPATLADPGITAAWEARLRDIAKGDADPTDFMRRIALYVTKYVDNLKTANMPPLPANINEEPPTKTKNRLSGRRTTKKQDRPEIAPGVRVYDSIVAVDQKVPGGTLTTLYTRSEYESEDP